MMKKMVFKGLKDLTVHEINEYIIVNIKNVKKNVHLQSKKYAYSQEYFKKISFLLQFLLNTEKYVIKLMNLSVFGIINLILLFGIRGSG